jgi:hypothetical protein
MANGVLEVLAPRFHINANTKFTKENLADFPTSPIIGERAFVLGIEYVYTDATGSDTWYPLSNQRFHHTHVQNSDATQWIVNHGLNSVDFIYTVYDVDGSVRVNNLPANIEIIDNNNFSVNFVEAVSGRCVVFVTTTTVAINTVTTLTENFSRNGDDFTVGDGDDNIHLNTGPTKYLNLNSSNVTLSGSGDMVLQGTLTAKGGVTNIESTDLQISDNVITLNKDVVGAPVLNAGIEVERGDLTNALFQWNETSDTFQAGIDGDTKDIVLTDDVRIQPHIMYYMANI